MDGKRRWTTILFMLAAMSPAGDLDSTINVFTYEIATASLCQIQTLSLLPENFHGRNIAAHLQVGAASRFLYIAVFAIDLADGMLRRIDQLSSGGKTPRNLVIDPTGGLLVVANRDSDNLAVFHIDPRTGYPTPTDRTYQTPSSTCLTFLVSERRFHEAR